MERKEYVPPELTVVLVKPERGFAESMLTICLLGLLSSAGDNELESRQAADQDWGDGGWY
jgi:hypothetical protein